MFNRKKIKTFHSLKQKGNWKNINKWQSDEQNKMVPCHHTAIGSWLFKKSPQLKSLEKLMGFS